MALLLGLALLIGNVARSAAHDTESLVVGTSELAYTSDWELIDSLPHTAYFHSRTVPYTAFEYAELPDQPRFITTNDELLDEEAIAFFETSEFFSDIRLVGAGTLADETLWRLYALRLEDAPFFLMVTGNTESRPGVDVVSTMLSPDAELIAAHFAVRDGFTVDGEPSPVARVDQEELLKVAMTWLLEDMHSESRLPGPPSQPAP
jgi:hypothetical protein